MKTLEIEGVKEGAITKLYDAGYDSLKKILKITLEEINKIAGFQDKSALKLYNALRGIQNSKCEKLLVASNIFGRGFGEIEIDYRNVLIIINTTSTNILLK